jgi:hypothetical protein
MNKLENRIIGSARDARKVYESMTGGHWIDHAPELFLQCEIARAVFALNFWVFIDATIKKTAHEIGSRKGRPPTNSKQRFDLTVWSKTGSSVRAVVEVKRTWWLGDIKKDAAKIEAHMKHKLAAKTGYLLVYSDQKQPNGDANLRSRFLDWANELNWTCVDIKTGEGKNYAWGFCLLRFDRQKLRD